MQSPIERISPHQLNPWNRPGILQRGLSADGREPIRLSSMSADGVPWRKKEPSVWSRPTGLAAAPGEPIERRHEHAPAQALIQKWPVTGKHQLEAVDRRESDRVPSDRPPAVNRAAVEREVLGSLS
jgi:hypothetical protein